MTNNPNPNPSPSDLTILEVAAELQSSDKTVRNWIKRGELEAIRYGTRFVRITRTALDEFKAAHSTSPAAKRAALLGAETVQAMDELASAAPALSEEQEDVVRAAFRDPPPPPPPPKMPRPVPRPKRVQ